MIEMFIIAGIVSLLSALLGAFIALKIQYGQLSRMQAHNEGWERAQESHQRYWEMKQEKYSAEVETRLTQKVQQLQKSWAAWEAKDQERIQTLDKQLRDAKAYLHVKHELARLPRIEERPLMTEATRAHQHSFPNWQPPLLQGADLSGQDLSRRYLAQADLRNAQLAHSNCFMADLSNAYLTGADLSEADLAGANLCGADLRGAILTGANLLVADLHGALLLGADLRGTHSLTAQQVYTAIYDNTTRFDVEIDMTHPRTDKTQPVPPTLTLDYEPGSTAKTAVVLPNEIPETPAPALSQETDFMAPPAETPRPPMLSDIELLIPEPSETPLSSPLSLSDSLLNPTAASLPGDTPENIHIGEFDTTVPNAEYNGNRQARAS